MIDWDRVGSLRTEIGADDFAEVVDLFLEEVEEVIARLEAAPDPSRYEEDLHFLKGSALNLGFSALSDTCHDGERRAATGQAESVDIASLIRLYRASRTSFIEGADIAPLREAG